jgi:putative ABC transport system permease protein
MQELRYAIRLLRRDPGYAALAVLTMALGIGATTTLFTVAYGVLMKPLPWSEPDRVMRVTETRKGQQARLRGTVSNGSYLAWRDAASTVEAVGGYGIGSATMTAVAKNGGEPARVHVSRLTASMATVLAVKTERGRFFTPSDEPSGGTGPTPPPQVVLLSHGLWQEWFGGRDDAIGSVVRLDDRPVTVVGVMPRDFVFPDPETRAWLPMPIGGVIGEKGVLRMMIFGAMARLKPGVTPEQASAEATARARSGPDPGLAAVGLFGSSAPPDMRVEPAVAAMTADVRPAIVLLLAAVVLLLVTATANVGSLQLTRATTRRRELAIRAALGASARDLRRQMIVEAGVIGAAGGTAGLALTAALVRILPSVLPADFPRAADVAVNVPVLAFVVATSVATSVACGMFPALEGAWVDVTHALAEEGAASAGASSRSAAARVRAFAMAGQVAVACLLLVGAALLGRSFVELMRADRGFEPSNVLSARVDLPRRYTPQQRVAFLDAVSARLGAAPGVVAAAGGNALPFVSMGGVAAFRMPSPSDPAIKLSVQATTRIVGPEYLKAMRLRLVSGRWLLDSDTASTRPVVVVSRSFVRKYLGDRVIGVSIPMSFGEGAGPASDVVGVVDDMRQDTVIDAAVPELFISYRQTPERLSTFPAVFVVRTSDDPMRHVQNLRTAVREQDPAVPIDSVMTMEERVAMSLAKPRLYALLLTGFAVAALAIAAVGLFGVLSYAVAQRAREIGVRTALGAQMRDIVVLVLRQALAVTAAGVGAGLLGAFVLTRYLSAFLYGVGRADPGSYVAVGVTVGFVAATACVVPARRAARVDPVIVLRQA